MPPQAYRAGSSPIIVQPISFPDIQPGTTPKLWQVPGGFFGRWAFFHYIWTVNAGVGTFRQVFINVLDPSGADCGQIIPGQAAVGGGGGVTNQPIHEFMDASMPVLFDQVFQGGAGVQPEWDYSGMGHLWYPDGWSFEFDASALVGGDLVHTVNGMIELIEAEAVGPGSLPSGLDLKTLAALLNTPG